MKYLPDSDFRSRRLFLDPDDFAIGSDLPDSPPRDLISEGTWRSIISLQDDVSIRTSNDFGSTLTLLWQCWSEWSCLVGALQHQTTNLEYSAICRVASDVGDEFQSSICNSLVGFYRVAYSSLRVVLENMAIGLQLELVPDSVLFRSWLNGDSDLGLGWAADRLRQVPRVLSIENSLQTITGDDLFRQKTATDQGGVIRRLFKQLSKFTHGAPGFTDADFRKSNGPIFLPDMFSEWVTSFRLTFAIAVVAAKLSKPTLRDLAFGSSLTAHELFRRAVSGVPPATDGLNLLLSLPPAFW